MTKRRKNRSGRKHYKKTTRKLRGGKCFGSGVGANNYDPNYNIYNTRMLGLQPYLSNPAPPYMGK